VQKEIEAGKLSGAPIRDLTITWELGVNRVRAHAPAVQELIRLIHQAVDERVASGSWPAMKPKSGESPRVQAFNRRAGNKQSQIRTTRLDRTSAN
jgi:hypothetical protein